MLSVYVRHKTTCKYKDEPTSRRCSCTKRPVGIRIEEERVLGTYIAPELPPEGLSLLLDNEGCNLRVYRNFLAHWPLLIAPYEAMESV
jgi:hypothetical protein